MDLCCFDVLKKPLSSPNIPRVDALFDLITCAQWGLFVVQRSSKVVQFIGNTVTPECHCILRERLNCWNSQLLKLASL